jgi:tetratricopeptide (TPR) repeat protein
MAAQQHPVRRKVALKVIKPGIDTRQVIARFEAERQALALMDHENIAKVFDAGATESGRPYFVMELVHGVPVTEYCDNNQLPPRQRLELFVQVCRAVQHAHTKGVIHRDIKPSNVLVTLNDGVAVPKVIDFGVAKATGQQLTEKTVFTNFAQMVGTPLYMSPEQAEMSGIDVDTRSDVYSLGVLLYELLTGTTPVDRERLKRAAFDEVRRIIREEEPPRPSTRVSTMGEHALTVSARRKSDPKRLGQLFRGELDWIVMKALEKDRARRYETATGLARDIERYLRDDPVEACPPSAAYRLRKFARRNRVALAGAFAVVAGLLLLVAGLAVSNRAITASRNETAEALRQKESALRQKESALAAARANADRADAQRQRAEKNFLKARLAVQNLLVAPALGQGDWAQLPAPLRKRFAEGLTRFHASLLQEDSTDPSLRYETAVGQQGLGYLYWQTRELKQAEELFRQSIGVLEGLRRESPADADYRQQLAWGHFLLGQTLRNGGRAAEAEAAARHSIDLYEGLVAERPQVPAYAHEVLVVYFWTGEWLQRVGRLEEAERAFERAVAIHEQDPARVPAKNPATRADGARAFFALAGLRIRAGRTRDAADLYSRGLSANPDDQRHWYHAAALYLSTGDVERYRGACGELLGRFEKVAAEKPEVAEQTAKTCALAPDSVPDFSRVERLAQRSVTGTAKHPWHRNFILAKGLADYRGGHDEQAIEWLQRFAPKADGTHFDSSAFAALGLAHHRLGHADQARASTDSARAIIAKKPRDAMHQADWFDWLHCEILCREAEQTLEQ